MPNQNENSFAIDLDQWPSVLAILLKKYKQEPHPVMKLWCMCDIVEFMLRLGAAVGFAELRALDNKLPEEIRKFVTCRI